MKLPTLTTAVLIALSSAAFAQGGGAGGGGGGGASSAGGASGGTSSGPSGAASGVAPQPGNTVGAGSSTTAPANSDRAKADNAANLGQSAPPTAKGGAPYQGLPGVNADGTPASPQAARNPGAR